MPPWDATSISELALAFARLQRRPGVMEDSPGSPAGLSPRVLPAAAGLLASLARRGVRHARLRALPGAGRLVLGSDDHVDVSRPVVLLCIASLREAAGLPAAAPHAAGSFHLFERVVRVETYACHDGVRAFVHVDGDDPSPWSEQRGRLVDLHAEALPALHQRAVGPEDLLAARQVATAADTPSLLTRHADLTLLSVGSRVPCAAAMADALAECLRATVRGPDWRSAREAVTECAAWVHRRGPEARPVRTALQACREAAPAAALRDLSAALALMA